MSATLAELKELAFIEDTHTYKLNGVVIPSVSELMEPLNEAKYKGISRYTLDSAADRGTKVHNCIENHIKFGIDDILPEHDGYFGAFCEWEKQIQPQYVGSEIRIYHKILRYGGTVDVLADIDGKLTLLDIKTTSVISDMTCRVQLEAYAQALKTHGIEVSKKTILHLKKDGKYATRDYQTQDAEAWRAFGALRCVYDYQKSA